MKKLTQEDFIVRANKIHDKKYNYSLVKYKNSRTKIDIICPFHGKFSQLPNHHLCGFGCKKCSDLTITKEKFIERANITHQNKYDYSKVEYEFLYKKIIIICPIHGEFKQIANNHLQGSGCFLCNGSKKSSTKCFKTKAIEKFGNKFDYSKTKYKTKRTKIKIICRKGHEFEQLPYNHLHGNGKCPICKKPKSTEDFIFRANKIHKGRYGYDKTEYKNQTDKIIIKCFKHGYYEQQARFHLAGSNCPICVKEGRGFSENELFLRKIISKSFPKLLLLFQYREHPLLKGLEIDIFIPEINLYIEWNGSYWHGKSFPSNIEKDIFKKNHLKNDLIQIIDSNKADKKYVKKIYKEKIEPEIVSRLKNFP